MSQTPSVLLVEDNALIMAGLSFSLDRLQCCRILGEVADGEAAVRESERLHPDVVLMDVGLPGIDGVEATWRIKQSLPRTRVIMFTSYTTPKDVTAALGAGADGYCLKDTPIEQIALAISAVMRGEIWLEPNIAEVIVGLGGTDIEDGIELSDVELQILELIKKHVENSQIAVQLNISPEKVANVMQRLIHHFMVEGEPEQTGNAVEEQGKEEKERHDWLINFVENLKDDNIFATRYLVEGLIGSGATGAVFKAKHLYMDRHVALKLLRPEYSEDRLVMRKFQREATAIGKLKHPNIVGVYDFGMSQKGEPYLAMEYVDGIDLDSILEKEGRLLAPRLIDICIQISAGLAEAHSKGIIHCNLKPSNILILGVEPNELVKVVDFGLAEIAPRDRSGNSDLTAKFLICGTPNYMSPEQCFNKPVDALSNIYSLGCILYECLTGVKIFDSESPGETISKECQFVPPPMSITYPGSFAPELEECVMSMLAKDPSNRPQSMNEVAVLLRSAREEQPVAMES